MYSLQTGLRTLLNYSYSVHIISNYEILLIKDGGILRISECIHTITCQSD